MGYLRLGQAAPGLRVSEPSPLGRDESELELGEPTELFRSAFDNAPIGIALTGTDGCFLAVNHCLGELTGRTVEELLQTTFQAITHPEDLAQTIHDARRMIAGERVKHEIEKRYLTPDGNVVWGLLRTKLVRDRDERPLHFISHILDITNRKEAEADMISSARRLQTLALRDPLTGLRNRHVFRQVLETEVERACRYQREISVVIFDIDGFSQINAASGSARADQVLRVIGRRIEESSRRPDLVARTGGDEFGLILPETHPRGARQAAQRISDDLKALTDLGATVSFGIAGETGITATAQTLIDAAETALHRSRGRQNRNGGETNGHQRLNPRAEESVRRILGLASEQLSVDLTPLRDLIGDEEICALATSENAKSRPGTETAADETALLRFLASLIEEVVEREQTSQDERESAVNLSGIHALLAALDARDDYTGEHSRTVVGLARAVAERLGLSVSDAEEVEQVALLHDVGKVGIPDSVLLKRGPLSQQEWALMREHPAVGERVVANTEGLAHLAPAIRAEHERYDGSGYPDGLRGLEIPIASRITLACDAYHAMTSDRPYRDALPEARARAKLVANAGSQFDPEVVEAILAEIDQRAGG